MDENHFSSYLLGRLAAAEAAIDSLAKAEAAPVEPPAPPPVDLTTPPLDYNARSRWYAENLERLVAGPSTPRPSAPAPEPLPTTLSKASPRFQRDMIKYVAEVASGQIEVVD